jgi:cysteine desulfurase
VISRSILGRETRTAGLSEVNSPGRAGIYLDNQASTPVDERVYEAMVPFFSEEFGNPHSSSHDYGRRAASAVEVSRQHVADLVDAAPEDVIFTSGATEANNLVLRGLSGGWGTGQPRLVILSTEHPSVIETAMVLAETGLEFVQLGVSSDGLVDLEQLQAELGRGPSLVSVGWANGEIGTVQPMAAIGALCADADTMLHTDASQAVGKIPTSLYGAGVDLLTLSGHKIYGPKGIGAVIATAAARRHLKPQIVGGGQQQGLRAGTLPTPLCVGLGMACKFALDCLGSEGERLQRYRTAILETLSNLGGIRINGSMTHRLPGNLNVGIAGVEALELTSSLRDVAISAGSACSSSGAKAAPSHVLRALGLTDAEARASVRIGLGRYTTSDEVERAARAIVEAVTMIRNRSD